jgi:hypothetical protein
MVAAAGSTTTEISVAGAGGDTGGDETDWGVGDDPQPDRVNTADSGAVTRRLLTQLEFISYTSFESEIQGTGRWLQWTVYQLLFNSSSTGNTLY